MLTSFFCVLLSLLLFPLASSAQDNRDSLSLKVLFRQNVPVLELSYQGNEDRLARFTSVVQSVMSDTLCHFDDITIRSGASPEGPFANNLALSRGRGDALKSYLMSELDLDEGSIIVESVGEDWEMLEELVKKNDVPDKDEILRILADHSDYVHGRQSSVLGGPKEELMNLNGGITWMWLLENIYPQLRGAGNTIVLHYTRPQAPSVKTEDSFEMPVAEMMTKAAVSRPVQPVEYVRIPLFAVKTNLLFDLFTAVNVEVEVPIGKRFSIAGEWIFPDWVDRGTNRYCLQANVKSVEGRYWFGDRQWKEKLTGHFIGAYGQWGDFDVQPFTEEGFRCFDGWAAGVSYGYAHSISRRNSLRLEYSIGVGYVWSDCCRYRRALDGAILETRDEWQYESGILPVPTKAKVSLVWMIYAKRRVK